ncbi:lipase family protein [Paludisphaera mucosa]|uniref:Lipase family protein n=1 Tax=Paludisphaera mucosa TaxID=3030827 RepID=A0ABT6F4F9_9BACT|nr:lipase family protein [Paludisphaera mucosa]MDG3002475.1 lipase family protein [Paludisphaera mucosa]
MQLPDRPPPRETLEGLTPPAADFPYFAFADAIRFEPSARAAVRSDSGAFIDANAWWLADAALLAYGDSTFLADRIGASPLPALGWRADRVDAGADLRAIVLDGPDALVIAFRGTRIPVPDLAPAEVAGLVDWILGNEDLKIDGRFLPAAREAGGRVHAGFLSAFEAISERIDAVVAARRPGQALWLTGHSLGGALAVLAASHLRETPIAGVYTYGAPRVGDAEFVATLPTCVHRRFVHRDDLIPRIPPAWPLGYRHAGEPQAVPGAAPRKIWREWSEGFQALAAAVRVSLEQGRLAVGEAPLLVRGLADHAPVYYATLLWNAVAAGTRQDPAEGEVT